jgi:hypothetical protein
MRIKFCKFCDKDFSAMFRIRYNVKKEWVFCCKNCLINIKEKNPYYVYGGTWKK